jgi:hypothetical protein
VYAHSYNFYDTRINKPTKTLASVRTIEKKHENFSYT